MKEDGSDFCFVLFVCLFVCQMVQFPYERERERERWSGADPGGGLFF